MKNEYRPEIDGLRAIAVLSVILFHADFALPGGFVGVDVFFVISGYLITNLIVTDLASGRFTFAGFYIRRIRRLGPAVVATVAATSVAAYFILSPNDLKAYAASAIGTMVTFSNVLFWTEANYFDTAALAKPLLHTWSLSVEEQFYYIWPALLVLALKKPRIGIGLLTLVSALSLYANIAIEPQHLAWVGEQPPSVASTIFYLTPFRIFEFAIGAAFVYPYRHWPARGWKAEAILSVGLALILWSVLTYDDKMVFPSTNAILPCLGAALAIYAGKARYVGALLRNPVAKGVGLISYSLYLVHWPLIVLVKYYYLADHLDLALQIKVLAATAVLSLLLYFLVELPFRVRSGRRPILAPTPYFLTSYVAVILALTTPAALAYSDNGWPWRMPKFLQATLTVDKAANDAFVWERFKQFETDKDFGPTAGQKVLIVGDSQSADFLNMMYEGGVVTNQTFRTFRINVACGTVFVPPDQQDHYYTVENTRAVAEPQVIPLCKKMLSTLEASPLIGQADIIVVANYWYSYSLPYVADTIARLKAMAPTAEIIFMGRKNYSIRSSVAILSHAKIPTMDGLRRFASTFRDPEIFDINSRLAAIVEAEGATFVDLLPVLCPTDDACDIVTEEERPIFYDQAHFTQSADAQYGQVLKDYFR